MAETMAEFTCESGTTLAVTAGAAALRAKDGQQPGLLPSHPTKGATTYEPSACGRKVYCGMAQDAVSNAWPVYVVFGTA